MVLKPSKLHIKWQTKKYLMTKQATWSCDWHVYLVGQESVVPMHPKDVFF